MNIKKSVVLTGDELVAAVRTYLKVRGVTVDGFIDIDFQNGGGSVEVPFSHAEISWNDDSDDDS